MSAEIQFTGVSEMVNQMTAYQQKVSAALLAVAKYWSAVFETYAKENAVWTDRTGNARQSLHSFIEESANDTVQFYLSHGVNYGVFLESKYAGKYAIIWDTIMANIDGVRKMLEDIFR